MLYLYWMLSIGFGFYLILPTLKFLQIKQTHLKPGFALAAPELAACLLRLSYTMENTFIGLAGQTRHSIMYFRVLANMVWLFGMLKQTDGQVSISFFSCEFNPFALDQLHGQWIISMQSSRFNFIQWFCEDTHTEHVTSVYKARYRSSKVCEIYDLIFSQHIFWKKNA